MKSKLFSLFFLILLFGGIFFTIRLVQQQQDIRQRASEQDQLTFFFALGGSDTPLQNTQLTQGETINLDLYVDTQNIPINSYDITVQNSSIAILALAPSGVTEMDINQRLERSLFNQIQDGNIHMARATTNLSQAVFGKIRVASLTFSGQAPGTVTLDIPTKTVTSPTNDTLTVISTPLAVSVTQQGTPIPSGTASTPTAPEPSNQNLLTNNSFENGDSGWECHGPGGEPAGGRCVVDSTRANSGTNSIKIDGVGLIDNWGSQIGQTFNAGTLQNESLCLSAYVYSETGGNNNFVIAVQDSTRASNQRPNGSSTVSTQGAWQRVQGTVSFSATNAISVYLRTRATGPLWFDDVSLTRGVCQ